MQLEAVPVVDLVVDAATYQFKHGGDAHGVTDRLLGVSVWDSFAAATSPLLVHRRLDGRLCVVDGHQRTGLAKRLQVPTLHAVVLSEPAVSVADARRLGARLNLQHGTGTALDIAKLLKMDPLSATERATIPTDALSGGLMRTGEGLVQLGEAAFRQVVNGTVHPHPQKNALYGAIVGRLVTDPDEQVAALARLAAVQPDSEFQAEALIRAILAAGFERGEQTDLFGTAAVTTSLAEPIAEVLTATRKVLQTDKVALAAALRHEDRLTSAGNVLNRDGNVAGVKQAAAAEGALSAFAYTVGPVRTELKRVAAAVSTRTMTIAHAADAVIRALKADAALAGPRPKVLLTGWDRDTVGAVITGILAEPRGWGQFTPGDELPVVVARARTWIGAHWRGTADGQPVTLSVGVWRAPDKTGVPLAVYAGGPALVTPPPGVTLIALPYGQYYIVPIASLDEADTGLRTVTDALAARWAPS